MKVSSSVFLAEKRPVLQELIAKLQESYRYCSVLATDNRAKNYSVSGRGVSASEAELYSNRGFVVRVMDSVGYAEYSFNELTAERIPAILDRIAANLIPMKDVLPETIQSMKRALPEEEKSEFAASTEYEIHPAEMGDQAILDHLTRIREAGKAADPRIMDCMASASWQEIHKIFLSPAKDMEQNLLWTTGSLVALCLKGQEMKMSHRGFSNLGGAEVLNQMENEVSTVANTAIELLNSEPLVPGEYECVCTPSVTGMIVHEAFGHGVEMDMFVKDRALAKSFVGEYVASELVTMHDGAKGASETGSYFFDDEGTLAHDTVIIENGILKQGISDLLSAGSLGTEPTGNGRRESYERKAYTRMTNTYFVGGKDKVEDMIASIEDGLLLDEPSSGMEDPKNWGIQCMVSFGREIKHGKLTGRIFSPIVLTGYVPDLLKSISMMSPTVELGGGGMCGKGYKEWVKVSDGGPYIKAKIRLG